MKPQAVQGLPPTIGSARRVPRRVAAATVLVGVAALVGYFLLRPDPTYPQIKFAGSSDDRFGIADIYHQNPAPETFGAIPVCQTGRPLTITSLEPVGGAGGLQIVDFAVRSWNGSGFGAGQVTLAKAGFTANRRVNARCDGSDELGVTVKRTAAGNGQWHDLRVHFLSAGQHRSTVIPFTLTMCGPQGTTTDTCGDAQHP
jgi:hypothetical protein